MNGESVKAPETLRWFCGVPLGTNPLILTDVMTMLAVGWAGSVLVLLGLQFFWNGNVGLPQVKSALLVASYLAGIVILMLAFICFAVMRNAYAVLYRLSDDRAICDHMRASVKAKDSCCFHSRGYPVFPVLHPVRNVSKTVLWRDVCAVQAADDMRVIMLKGERGILVKIYCPDEETFLSARNFIGEHCKRAVSTASVQ